MNTQVVDRTARRSRQLQVEALLTELDERRRELFRLSAFGVRRAGLRDQKRELLIVREQLLELVASRS